MAAVGGRIEFAGPGSEQPVEAFSPHDLPDCCSSGSCMSPADVKRAWEQADADVEQHEVLHHSTAGQWASSAPIYEFKVGPDGKNYRVAGKVYVDTSIIEGDDRATVAKMQQLQKAALAPNAAGCRAKCSDADYKVAAECAAKEQTAQARLNAQK